MKILRLVFATLAIGVASISSAQAHDSFSLGLSFGNGYSPYEPPVVRYYSAPPVVYYGAPSAYYYDTAPSVYYYPQASFGWNHGWGEHRWHEEHEEHERHEHEGHEHHGDRGDHGDRGWR